MLYRLGVLTIVVVPFLSVFVAIWQLWKRLVGWKEVFLLFATFFPIAFGITVGYHRHYTHMAFRAKPWVRRAMGVFGLMALEGPITKWVADHRRHHKYAEQDGDPHSTMKGLFHAHIGWLFSEEESDPKRFARFLLNDPLVQRLDKEWPVWAAVSIFAPLLGGWRTFLWAGLVRIFLVHHFTWSINSICHAFGIRPYCTPTNDTSGNVCWLVLSLGENYHNTHHAFPQSARHGTNLLNDPSYALILFLEKLGLVWDVKVPTKEKMAKALKIAA